MSTALAYLKPAMRRGNLVVRTNARALAVEFEGSRATGVRYMRGDSLASPVVVVRDE